MEITPAGSFASPAPTACASCVLGAYSSRILSFTSSYIEHITVSVTPHIMVYANGSRSTSFESNTLTKSAIVGGIAGSNSTKTYAKKQDITWTVDGATLTYPTKYVQYLGFSGGPAATGDADTCAETTDAHAISLPETTEAASFIYALPANATALALPTPLLQYLGSLDDFADQFDGAALTGCAPLDGAPGIVYNSSAPFPTAGNASTALATGYRGPSNALPSHQSQQPTGYITTSNTTLASTTPLSTGYDSSSAVMSTLPVLSGSSGSLSGSYTGSTGSASDANGDEPTAYSSSRSSLATIASSEAEHASQSSKFSILPHPYLNTTFSRSASSSEMTTHSVPKSTPASVTPGTTEYTMSSGDSSFATTTKTSITNPGSIFSPSSTPGGDNGDEESSSVAASDSSVASIQTTDYPPKPPAPTGSESAGGGGDGMQESSTPAMEAPSSVPESYMTAVPSPSSNNEGQNVHTTAFVIEPITGPALISYENGPTKTTDDVKAPGYTNDGGNDGGNNDGGDDGGNDVENGVGDGGDENGGNNSGGEGGGNVDEDTPRQTQVPNVSDLVDDIVNAVDGTNDDQDSNAANDQTSNDEGNDDASHSSDGGDLHASQLGGSNAPSGQTDSINVDLLTRVINSAADYGDGQARATGDSVYSAGNTVMTAQPNGAVVIGEQTVSPGQSITVGSGSSTTVVALQTGGGKTDLIIAGSTFRASPGNAAITAAPGIVADISSMALIKTNGQTITAIQSGSSLILQDGTSSTTVGEAEAVTFAGETILAAPTEEAVFVNGNITPLTAAEGVQGASKAVISVDGHTITAVDAGNSMLLVDGSTTKTLQDGSNVVFQGQKISAQGGGMAVVVNGHTSTLKSAIALATGQAVVTADGLTFSFLDLPGFVVLQDGTSSLTIRDGATATFDGETITALASGDAVVVDGKTISMTSPVNLATAEAVITAGGHAFTVLDMDGYIILEDGDSTLTVKDGMTATFEGQTIKALPSGDAVVVNEQMKSLTSVEASATSDPLDEYINRGLSGGEPTTSSQTVETASEPTGGADSNGARALVTSLSNVAMACLFGIVAGL